MISKEFSPQDYNVKTMMENAETARLKGRLASNASNQAVKVLKAITGASNCKIVKADISGLSGDRVFSGTLRVTASIVDKGDVKEISIPFMVEKSTVKSPDQYIIKKKLASIQPKTSRHLDEVSRMNKVVAEMKVKDELYDKENDELIKDSPLFEKGAKEIEIPSSGINTPEKDIVKSMLYEKVNLPDDTEAGDVININGRKWAVEEGVADFGQASATTWNLKLIEESK